MQKVTTYIIIIGLLFGGLLLLFRYSLTASDLIRVDGRMLSKKMEAVFTRKGSNRYGLIFEIENAEYKYGVYVGTADQIGSTHDLFSLIDTGKIYTLFIDPSVSTQNGVKLGVREIYFDGKRIFKESSRFDLFLGIFLTLLSIISLVLVSKTSRTGKPS